MLTDYGKMSLKDALGMPMYLCDMYFASEHWNERKQEIEQKLKFKYEMAGDLKACSKLLEYLLKKR